MDLIVRVPELTSLLVIFFFVCLFVSVYVNRVNILINNIGAFVCVLRIYEEKGITIHIYRALLTPLFLGTTIITFVIKSTRVSPIASNETTSACKKTGIRIIICLKRK